MPEGEVRHAGWGTIAGGAAAERRARSCGARFFRASDSALSLSRANASGSSGAARGHTDPGSAAPPQHPGSAPGRVREEGGEWGNFRYT
eukprot:scaffold4659_cov125-Isochrysis_galbana.AAC.3